MIDQVGAFFGIETTRPTVSIPRGRADLPRLFHDLGFRKGAEIGVWQGEFAEQICQAITAADLICVDPWKAYGDYRDRKNDQARLDDAFEVTRSRLMRYWCHLWRMTSLEAVEHVEDRSLDFVYIDGNHAESFVRDDISAWLPKVRPGGILSGHDYTDRRAHLGVKPAVDRVVSERGIKPLFVLSADKSPSFFWVVS